MRAVLFRHFLVRDAAPVQIADIAVAGTYQLGGNTEDVVWGQYKVPDQEGGTSPVTVAGQVSTMWLPEGCQVFAATGGAANMDTHISLWLVWPGSLPLQS